MDFEVKPDELTWELYERMSQDPHFSEQIRKDVSSNIVAAWIEGLAKWDCFFTGTFRGPRSPASAQRSTERFMKRHCRSRSVFYCIENHPMGHGAHVHGLIASQGGRRDVLWRNWFDHLGRARFEPIRNARAVAAYCHKHKLGGELTKQFRDGIWWNVLNCNRRENLQDLRA